MLTSCISDQGEGWRSAERGGEVNLYLTLPPSFFAFSLPPSLPPPSPLFPFLSPSLSPFLSLPMQERCQVAGDEEREPVPWMGPMPLRQELQLPHRCREEVGVHAQDVLQQRHHQQGGVQHCLSALSSCFFHPPHRSSCSDLLHRITCI